MKLKNIFSASNGKNTPLVEYHPESMKPIIRCSICTGEQTAGFKDKETGHFTEVMLIRDGKDLAKFKNMYHLDSVEKEY